MRRATLALVLAACSGDGPAPIAAPTTDVEVREVGFRTPESVLHDADADVYLVSNIDGSPFDEDDNGFISRVAPDGRVLALRWIDGQQDGVTLHAPKGMALHGDVLWVVDVGAVRAFDRRSGKARDSIVIDGAVFLNDVAVRADGSLLVTDTALALVDGAPRQQDGAALYAIRDGQVTRELLGKEVGAPNGVVALPDGYALVTWDEGKLLVRTQQWDGAKLLKSKDTVTRVGVTQLDGLALVSAPDQPPAFVASSWQAGAVLRVSRTVPPADAPPQPETFAVTRALEGLMTPADIGFDARRRRLLIPLFAQDAIALRALPD